MNTIDISNEDLNQLAVQVNIAEKSVALIYELKSDEEVNDRALSIAFEILRFSLNCISEIGI